ncbi:MAG: MFS transporter, partial [Pseudomonadota bacterium]
AMAHHARDFYLAAVAIGISNGIMMPTFMTLAINKVEPNRRGMANGMTISAFDLGLGLGSIALGVIAKYWGLPVTFFTCALIMVVALPIFNLVEIRVKKS